MTLVIFFGGGGATNNGQVLSVEQAFSIFSVTESYLELILLAQNDDVKGHIRLEREAGLSALLGAPDATHIVITYHHTLPHSRIEMQSDCLRTILNKVYRKSETKR